MSFFNTYQIVDEHTDDEAPEHHILDSSLDANDLFDLFDRHDDATLAECHSQIITLNLN